MDYFWARLGLAFFIFGTVGAFAATETTSIFILCFNVIAQISGLLLFLLVPLYSKKDREDE